MMKYIALLILLGGSGWFTIPGQAQETDGTVTFGGELYTQVGTVWEWGRESDSFVNPSDAYQYFALRSSLEILARPSELFSAYANLSLFVPGWPIKEDFLENAGISDLLSFLRGSQFYAEVSPLDFLTFRAGKRFLNWGMGYYFSPADFVNPEPIDLMDFDRVREGPLLFSVEAPVSPFRLMMHLILSPEDRPWEIIAVPQAELLFGPIEGRLGGWYRNWTDDAGISRHELRGSLAVAADIFFFKPFVEASVGYGSDRKYIVPTDQTGLWPPGVMVETHPEIVTFSVTAGGSVEFEALGLRAYGQYLFNSAGYFYVPDFTVLYGTTAEALLAQERISEEDLYLASPHYGAAEIAWDIFETGLTLAVSWIGDLHSFSGVSSASLAYSPVDFLEIEARLPFSYHDYQHQFSDVEDGFSFDLSVTAGGSF